jgi:dolichol-phosphate mannosyltransferase
MKASIIIPTMNEPGITQVVKGLQKNVPKAEIIVVDQSTDSTAQKARKAGARIIYQSGTGFGDACVLGASKASGEIIVFIDGDDTYNPEDVPKIIKPILNGEADYVIGNRFKGLEKNSMKKLNSIGNKILSWTANKLYHTNIKDSQTGLRAITKKGFEKLYLTTRNFDFYTQMNVEAKKRGLSIKEIPISYRTRKGKTKLKPISDGLVIAGTTVRLIRDYNPFMVFGLPGLISLIIGLGMGIFILIEYLQTGTVSRVPTTMLSSMLMISGVFFIGMALMIDLLLRELEHR